MREKVLVLVHNLLIGGVSTSLINVSRLLINHGCEVTVKTTSAEADQDVLNRLDPRIRIEIMDEKRFPILEKLPYFRNFYESGCWTERSSAKKVYNYYIHKAERNKYDVEMAFYFGRPVKAICGSSNSKARKIMWIRLGLSDDRYHPGFKTKERALIGYNAFDKIIGVSEEVSNNFIKYSGVSGEKVVTVHNFLDRQNIDVCLEENCELEKDRFTIACVCRLAPIKNLMVLLHVVKRLQDEGIDCACWFIGDGPMRAEMETYIKDNEIRDIKITGFQKNPHKYVKKADLYVFPSLMEGYPNTLADSMYIGTPIVSTRCVGAANILHNGKYGVLTGFDDDSLYQGVKSMIENPEIYNRYKKMLADYDFEADEKQISEQLLDIIVRG